MTLSDKTWIILTAGLGIAVVGLMGGQIDYGLKVRANGYATGLSQQAVEPVPVSPLRASIPFAGEPR